MPCFPPLHDQQWSQILGATSTNRMPEGDGINGSKVIEPCSYLLSAAHHRICFLLSEYLSTFNAIDRYRDPP